MPNDFSASGTKWLNRRLSGAPGSGAFFLTERREGLEKLLEIGREVVTFENFDELVDQSRTMLECPDAGRSVADAAAFRSHRDHRYEMRLERILNVLFC